MCGICGVAVPAHLNRRVDEGLLVRMRDSLTHRGPDGEGVFIDGNVGLGHRRLSIVDVANGAQPMFDADRTLAIVYNGEVYNHSSERAILTGLGHSFENRSDTETILHLYDEY